MVFGLRYASAAPGSSSRTDSAPDGLVPEVNPSDIPLAVATLTDIDPLPLATHAPDRKPNDPLHASDD